MNGTNHFNAARQSLTAAHASINAAETTCRTCSGVSASKQSTAQRIATLRAFRNALENLTSKSAMDVTLTVGTGKQTFRLYGTKDNVRALVGRVTETINELL